MSACAGCGTPLPQSRGGRPRKWCSEWCRKDQYGGTCIDCGAPTDGSNGRANAPERCHPCWSRFRAIWTSEAIIVAIQAWADEHGAPPVATDWNPNHAVSIGHPEKAERFYADDAWPHTHTVCRVFGRWADAIVAAGFDRPRPGIYDRTRIAA